MLASAGVGFMVYAAARRRHRHPVVIWVGVLVVAVLTGGVLGALHAWLTVTFRVNQIISGVVINLFALGLTGFLRSEVIVKQGVTTGQALPKFGIPLLDRIPVIGNQLFRSQPIFFMMIVVVLLTVDRHVPDAVGAAGAFERREPARRRDAGHQRHQDPLPGRHPRRLHRRPRRRVVLAGGPGRLRGQHDQRRRLHRARRHDLRQVEAVAGVRRCRAVRIHPGARARGCRSSTSRSPGSQIPSTFWQMLPYVATLVVVAGAVGRAIPPAAEGMPYERSR